MSSASLSGHDSAGLRLIGVIYEKAEGNNYRFIGTLSFLPEFFRVDKDPVRIVVKAPLADPPGAWTTTILRYRGGDPAFEECLPRGSNECRDSDEDFSDWRERIGLHNAFARLSDLEENDAPDWFDAVSGAPIQGLGGLRDLRVIVDQ